MALKIVITEDWEMVECPSCGDLLPSADGWEGFRQCSTCAADQYREYLAEDEQFHRDLARQQGPPKQYPSGRRDYEQMIADFWRIYHGRPEPRTEPTTKKQLDLFGRKKE